MEKLTSEANSKNKKGLTAEQKISLKLDSEMKVYKDFHAIKQSFLNILWLFFRKYFTSISTIYILLICSIMLITMCLVFPPYFSVTPTLSFNFLISGFLVYGIYFYNIRNSTFYNSFSINIKYRFYIYTSIFLLMLFSNIIVMLFTMFFTLLMYWINVIWPVFPYPTGVPRFQGQQFFAVNYSFTSIGWGIIVYCLFLITSITFALSFAIQANLNTIKGFFVITSGIILLNLIFGGCLFFAFGPNIEGTKVDFSKFYDNGISQFEYKGFFINLNSDYVRISGSGTEIDPYVIKIAPTQMYIHDMSYISEDEKTIINYRYYEVTNFGDLDTRSFLWVLSQIFPFYHVNQMLFSAFYANMDIIPYDPNYVPPINNPDFPDFTDIFVFTVYDNQVVALNSPDVITKIEFLPFRATNAGWWLVLTFPYVNIIFYWCLGFAIAYLKKY
ncbi:MAG: hypothetical protein HPPSJP_3870 [Candidatus Hepatoplasma scabrum]|nr:MAG: hypothetical protein HPPSJP_3870 [Candidatus Hepatoplasma sp.]